MKEKTTNKKAEKNTNKKAEKNTNKKAGNSSDSILPDPLVKLPIIDNELDNLFKSSAFPPLKPIPVAVKGVEETAETPEIAASESSPDGGRNGASEKEKKGKLPRKEKSRPKTKKMDDPQSSQLEVSYETKRAIERAKLFAQQLKQEDDTSTRPPKQPSEKSCHHNGSPSSDQASSDDLLQSSENLSHHSDQDSTHDSDGPLVHETVLARKTCSTSSHSDPKTQKPSKTSPQESPEQKNARTVFVGNVHIDCVKNKSASRALLEHLLNPLKEEAALGTHSRIESIRYRGIPLATPIGTEPAKPQHGAQRSKAWKEAQAGSRPSFDDVTGGSAGRRGAKPLESSETSAPPVKFLTGGQKRMIGYVTGDLHPEAKSCLAYVVIAPPPPGDPSPGSSAFTGAELAKLIATKADGTSFMERVIRCDIAFQPPTKNSSNSSYSIDLKEQRRTLFIGGLDFVEEEDSIRKAVESRLMEEKKGLPDGAPTWVERVRVVRDKATSLTKGFAYVLLRTQDAVEEMLALPEGSFKIGKRKVRLQKYLSAGQSSALKRTREQTTGAKKPGDKRSKVDEQGGSTTGPKRARIDLSKEIETTYKGPDLSQELAGLDKHQRKLIKSANQLRVERRMLKKQNLLKQKILASRRQKHSKNTEFLNQLKPIKSAINKLAKNNKSNLVPNNNSNAKQKKKKHVPPPSKKRASPNRSKS